MSNKRSEIRKELQQEFFNRIRWMADHPTQVWAHLSGKHDHDLESDVSAAIHTATAEGISAGLEELLVTASDYAGEKQKVTEDDGSEQETEAAKLSGRSWMYLRNADALTSPSYRPEDLVRAQAIILFAAWQIEASNWFQEFRRSFLDGTVLPLEKTLSFLLSPALRLLPTSVFAKHGENLRTHEALLLDEGTIMDGERLRRRYSLLFPTSEKEVCINYDEEAMRSYDNQPLLQPEIGAFFADYAKATYYPGTAFDEIMQAADLISSCLLGCSHRAALAFLLRGKLPDRKLIRAEWLHSINVGGDLIPLTLPGTPLREAPSYSPSHITMTVPIWLSADVVERAFRQLQQEALHGKENRQSREQKLHLLIYVLSEKRRAGIANEGTEDQRRKIWASWNDLCGKSDTGIPGCNSKWKISDFAQFTRACKRVEENLFPSFFHG